MDTHYRRRHSRSYQYLARDAGQLGGVHLWLAFRLLPGLLLISLVLLLLSTVSPRASAAITDDSFEDLASGQMLMRDESTGSYLPALLQSSKAHFDISGLIATVTVEQQFRNDSDQWLEGVYAFPLPPNAAVRSMQMTIGERRIVGKIKEKAAARKIYQQAKQAGKKASLVEQQRPNLFTNRVANIGPGEEIRVTLEYVQEVDYHGGEFSLRFPTTITPRYMPGKPMLVSAEEESGASVDLDPYLGWALPTNQVPDANAISPLLNPLQGSDRAPLNPVEITVRLDMGMPLARVEAPYHELALARNAGVYDVRLSNTVTEMNRDFVLNWEPVTGAAPTAAMFTEQVDGDYFGLLMVLPPAARGAAKVLPREIVIVVDTSGSMGGVSIEQARQSVSRALQQLRPQDRFNIIEFNSRHRALYRGPMPATRHHVQQAQEFVRLLQASGGTEMLSALQAALAPSQLEDVHREQAALRQVIFITDGAVGNEAALFEEISLRLGDSRLFTVGIGSAPNSWFMREAAKFGRGTHTHIGKVEEVGEKMAVLFEQLAQPVAVDLEVNWPATVEAWPERIPDLYAGQPLLVAASFGPNPPQGEVVVSAELLGKPWSSRLQLAAGDPLTAAQHKGVASLWARQKIGALLDQIPRGRDESAVRADVLPVALQHHLLSPYTSFVAVEEVVSRPAADPLGRVALANTRPQGQSPQPYAYPATATTGPARLWLGLMLLFLALLLHLVRTPEVDHVPTKDV